MNFLKKLFCKKEKKTTPLPDFDTVVEIMSKQVPRYTSYEIIKVVYSRDKTSRYVVLKSEIGYLTYRFERLFVYDEEEMRFFSDGLPGYWLETDYGCYHVFDDLDELMAQLTTEPEYITEFL